MFEILNLSYRICYNNKNKICYFYVVNITFIMIGLKEKQTICSMYT